MQSNSFSASQPNLVNHEEAYKQRLNLMFKGVSFDQKQQQHSTTNMSIEDKTSSNLLKLNQKRISKLGQVPKTSTSV